MLIAYGIEKIAFEINNTRQIKQQLFIWSVSHCCHLGIGVCRGSVSLQDDVEDVQLGVCDRQEVLFSCSSAVPVRVMTSESVAVGAYYYEDDGCVEDGDQLKRDMI
ncbi:hypothetical protein JTE90_005009 [Oedothorax gibbosus]|uniref:Uncharacterized protein n=1 Tax=Oedothorax gibbosus TaxID=931172 RepID=A0AAV6VDD6_9ARAC|nr:hypothetical protein JTE90_005009 [Oedothorax gibbosus]